MIDNLKYEKELYEKGYNLICGVDEVGRGPLVGPVVAAAVILPKNYQLEGLTDSKKISEKKREYLYDIIMKDAIAVGIGEVSAKEIDEINIYAASRKAMEIAISKLDPKPDYILGDAI
jgi:ribonuclease HII